VRTNSPIDLTLKVMLVLMICFGLSTPVSAASNNSEKARGNQYRSDIVYKGEYTPTALYYRSRESQPWMRRSKSDNYLESVTCSRALAMLATEGQWLGNLNRDGSCGTPIEPSTFMLGNRLNYDDSISGISGQ